ncbi:MAG: hypothetical protein DMD59_01840 [Gemmatimonadetes bacterium]|nr:MAG: hypothetical protein DMD59_01840 [Gemmatimonadota bacterium]
MLHAAFCLTLIVQGPPETTTRMVTAHDWVVRLGKEMGDSIWPGFRPDTIPVLYVVPGQGTLLLGWRGDLPQGFLPITGVEGGGWQSVADRGAASTGTQLAGRAAAQVVVHDSQGVASLVGLTTHEAFHVFAAASKQEGNRFGQSENSFLVTSYPVFDPRNEAGMALEGRILEAAEQAPGRTRRRTLARQFLAVRESRHRALGAELADFEQLAELNEGLAEYTLVRAVQLAARLRDFPDRVGASRLQTDKLHGLRKLTDDVTLSIRLRYYLTGPALGLLLDALEGPAWKTRLVAQNLTVQDALADAVGYRSQELALRRQAESTFVIAKLRTAADSGVAGLRAFRKAQVDSLLNAPGVQLVVTVTGRYLGLCGIDPQNLLQVEPGVLLHTRWLQACAGDFQATFNTPVVQDRTAQTLRAVVGADSTVKVTTGAQGEVRIESPLVSLRAGNADVSRDGRVLTVKIKN